MKLKGIPGAYLEWHNQEAPALQSIDNQCILISYPLLRLFSSAGGKHVSTATLPGCIAWLRDLHLHIFQD
jgi:hypothetical protein